MWNCRGIKKSVLFIKLLFQRGRVTSNVMCVLICQQYSLFCVLNEKDIFFLHVLLVDVHIRHSTET